MKDGNALSQSVFLVNLDGVVTKEEILPLVLSCYGTCWDRNRDGAELIKDLWRKVPAQTVNTLTKEIKLNTLLVSFLQKNRPRCRIVTEYPEVWIKDLIRRLDLEQQVFCSEPFTENGGIQEALSLLDKNAAASQMQAPYVAVGNRANDAEMLAGAEIAVGYGGVTEVPPSVMDAASHVIYEEEKLVDFLQRLL